MSSPVVQVEQQETVASEVQEALRHAAVYGLGNVLAKAIGFFMLPLYTRYLVPAEYGTLEILDLTISLFGMFLTMGMITAMLRVYAAAGTPLEKNKVVSTAFWFVVGTGMLAFSIGLPWIRAISARLLGPDVPPHYLLLSFASFTLSYIAIVPRTYLRALDASGQFVLVDTVSLIATLGLNVVFIVVLRLGIIGILLSSLIVFGVQVVGLSVWLIGRIRMLFSGARLREMLNFGAPLAFANLSIFALNFSDRFFLQHLRSLELVGIYAVGYKVGFMMNYLLVQPFCIMWQSRIYAIQKRPDHGTVFGQILIFYSLLLIYSGLGLALFSPEVVELMAGPKYVTSHSVVPLVTFAYVLYGIGNYVQAGMFLRDQTKVVAMISSAAAILNLALNYLLVLEYGMLGAAWATLISFAAIGIASYVFSQRIYPLPLGAGRTIAALMLAVGSYLLCLWLSPINVAGGIAVKSACLVLFPIMIWKLRILAPAEEATLVSAGKRGWVGVLRFARRGPAI